MRVYVSGPIKGMPDGNRREFAYRTAEIEADGNTAVNPHTIDHAHEGECIGPAITDREDDPHHYGCYLRADIIELLKCDAISLLPGWAGSLGAQTELSVAKACGIPMYQISAGPGPATDLRPSAAYVMHPSTVW